MSPFLPNARRIAALALALLGVACAEPGGSPVAPPAPVAPRLDVVAAALPPVRISELHYDNAGADAGEAIEVSFPTGTDLSTYSIVLYNGAAASRSTYGMAAALGALPVTTCNARGVVVVNYPTDGIQNGSPDGIALVNGTTVVEFLSYEGTFVAANGPAIGMTSIDIGVAETGTTPIGQSLQRTAAGDNTWTGPTANTFGACNDVGGPDIGPLASVTVSGPTTVNVGETITLTALAEDAEGDDIAAGTVVWSDGGSPNVTVTSTGDRTATVTGDVAGGPVTITATLTVDGVTRADDHAVTVAAGGAGATNVRIAEIHYDNDGTDTGEAIEVEGDAGGSLAGWSLVLYTGSNGTVYNTTALSATIPATCGPRGVVVVNYPVNGIQNGQPGAAEPDGVALVNAAGTVVEFLSYEGSFTATNGPAVGMTSVDIGVDEDPAPPAGQSLQRAGNGVWFGPATATFGACNAAAPPPPPPPAGLTLIGRSASDPPLPIRYQDQLFAQSPPGTTLPHGTVVWSVDNPTIASVDQEGVVTGLATGTAIVRATRTADGVTGTLSVPVADPPDGPAVYQNHLDFGRPLDLTPADDILLTWPEFTSSYNPNRGQPNWIAYNLEATHRGPADRCECFTHDPSLPAGVPVLTTDDYTGSGYSRGHMVMSEDRTSGPSATLTSIDNARTFLFSNIIPQTAENNGGPWLSLETYLGSLATGGTKELYIYAGGAAYSGTLKNEGKVAIPTRTWKIAVIVDRDEGVANVGSVSDVEVIAVDMPNATGGLSSDWTTYRVSVDHVEALTGYDFLAALPDAIECRVEQAITPVANCAPEVGLQTTAVSGRSVTVAARFRDGETTDAPWRVSINWGDGTAPTTATSYVQTWNAPLNRGHVYAAPGTYTITLTVTDKGGRSATQTVQVTVT